MKDSCISKLIVTKIRYQATQYKKIIDTLPALCADKNLRYIYDALCRWFDLSEATLLPPNPDFTQWSNTYNIVEIKTVNPNAVPDQVTGERLDITRL